MAHAFRENIAFIESAQSQIDTEAGVIRGVKILGRISRNGREYTDRAMEQAKKLYEGRAVNTDHPDRSQPQADRKVSERFGVLEAIVLKADGVYGDLKYLKTHPQAATIVEMAQRMPGMVGLSHNAQGSLTRKGDKWQVESLESVRSVDLVADPATNRGLFESEATMTLSVREIFQASKNPRLVALIEDDMAPPMDSPVDVGTDSGSDDQIKSAFMAAMAALLDEPDKATASTKARKLLSAYFGIKDDGEQTTESTQGKSMAELAELQEQVKDLTERNRLADARESVRKLVDAAKAVITDAQLKAAMNLQESDRQAFVDLLPKQKTSAPPATSPPRFSQMNESVDPNLKVPEPKDFASAIRG